MRSGVGYGLPRFPYRALPLVLEKLAPFYTTSLHFATSHVTDVPKAISPLITVCTGCALCTSFDAAEQPLAKRVLKECEEEFFQAVAVNEIARELCQKKVIHQDVVDKINKSATVKEARGHLFDHLMEYGTVASLKDCCDVMMSEEYDGYRGMQDLGKKMKAMLEQEG